MGLFNFFRSSNKEEDILKGLIEKIEQLNPRKWSVEANGSHFECGQPSPLFYSACSCRTRINKFSVLLTKYVKGTLEEDNWCWGMENIHYDLHVFDKEGGSVCEFTGEKVEKLYCKVYLEVKKYKKTTQEEQWEQEVEREKEEEKTRQLSLKKLRKIL